MSRRALAATLALAAAGAGTRPADGAAARAEQPAAQLLVFTLQQGRVTAPPRAPSGTLAIGSLAKPFVARAWARAHPGQPSPVLRCSPGSHCWNAAGHGTVGLVRAVALSCNTYFRALAAETPLSTLAATLHDAGLAAPDPLSVEAAIGLPTETGLVAAEPAAVLHAYAALVDEPWGGAEAIRREVCAGLRDSARDGTAAALAGMGFRAKTGTVPALDGRALATSGWALAIDESSRGFLALLTPGTGREAARALARRLRAGGPDRSAGGDPAASGTQRLVRVSLFSALSPRSVQARNLGPAPLSGTRGFVGASGSLELRPGDRLEAGDWELTLPAHGLRRVVRGALRVDAGLHDALRILVDVSPIEYVAGVLAAELPPAADDLREPLGAAVLRFLAEGPRHGDADRCDLTHCAFFVGRGPRAAWTTPFRATLLEPPGEPLPPAPPALAEVGSRDPIDAASWQRMLAASREDGPARWTSHCGGEPLSAHAVWGGTDGRVYGCLRHGPANRAPWTRRWRLQDVERALGAGVRELRVTWPDGRWLLRVERDGRPPLLLAWDEAHERLARVLGWGALPSPADRVVREDGGYRAVGRGLGHRVGLCLGGPPAPALLD